MKKATMTFLSALLVMGISSLNAQVHGGGFIDEDGDGYHDLAPDHDGDGIPNGVDEDFVQNSGMGNNFVDEDGDGFNDNALDDDGDGIINCEDEDWEGSTGPRSGNNHQFKGRIQNEGGSSENTGRSKLMRKQEVIPGTK